MKKQGLGYFPEIRIIDSIMGSGKTTYTYESINARPEQRYLYICKYLSEAIRIQEECPAAHFVQPKENNYGSKQPDFLCQLKQGMSIAITHELYRRLELTEKFVQYIRQYKYTLILDEVPCVIELLAVSEKDRKEILDRYAQIDENGLVKWTDNEYKGNHEHIMKQVKSKAVNDFNNTFMWLFPIELIQAFDEINVLTFLFEGSHMKSYLDIHHMPFSIYHVKNGLLVEGQQNLSEELSRIRNQLEIYDGKLNDIGKTLSAMSSSWWKKQKQQVRDVVECNAYNYLYNIHNASADNAMWSKIKGKTGRKPFLNRRHYATSFCPCNASATNMYRHRKYLAYLVNVYDNPVIVQWFRQNGIELDEDKYALSQLVQWIWRSAIRDGNKVHLYLPSIRMRTILIDFLNMRSSDLQIA